MIARSDLQDHELIGGDGREIHKFIRVSAHFS